MLPAEQLAADGNKMLLACQEALNILQLNSQIRITHCEDMGCCSSQTLFLFSLHHFPLKISVIVLNAMDPIQMM